jgi:4-amino-4-deoxy-L-arabinose transferase-like glycosyltransferase
MSRRYRLLFIFLVLFYVAGAVSLALVRQPHEDEGHFANAAVEFIDHGRLAMPMWTDWVPSLDRCMFVTLPLYFMQLGVWASVFGGSIAMLRLDSVLWGLVLVLSWAGILRRLMPDSFAWLTGVVLIAGNYDVMSLTSARYDPMAAALNALAVFCYLHWRERNLPRAVLLANTCLALACLTHPYVMFGIAGFAVFFVFFDLRRLSPALILLAALPYVVAFGAYGMYIWRYPVEFREQLGANAQGRLRLLTNPAATLGSDFVERYVRSFSGFRSDVPSYMKVKILLVVAWIAAFAGCFLIPSIRRNRKLLALAVYGLVCWLLLAFFEGTRMYNYLVHAVPAYSAVLAIPLAWFAARGPLYRSVVAVALVLFLLYSAATILYRIRRDDYNVVYMDTMRDLQANVRPGDLVMGGAEFGPGLGFREHVLADRTLGYRNGLHPDLIVIDSPFRRNYTGMSQTNPQLHQHITDVLAGFDRVYTSAPSSNQYEVYVRRSRRAFH